MNTLRNKSILEVVGLLAIGASVASSADTRPDWYYSDTVDFAFVEEHATVPMRTDALIVDSRPARKFDQGHISPAVNIPWRKFEEMAELLPADKAKTLIFYCGGLKCPLSHKSAFAATARGYTAVKVYAAGYPDWIENGGLAAISAAQVKKLIDKGASALIVDSRPKRKFDKGHVPTAVNVPDRSFDKMVNLLPSAKDKPLVFYCGGYNCKLSPNSATKALALGYTDVKLFQAGYPAWVKAYGAGGSAAAAKAGAETKVAKVAIETGADDDTITLASFEEILASAPQSIHLIDVRDPEEFAAGALPSARNMTVDQVEEGVSELPADKPIVFVCATGARSGEAYDIVKLARADIEVYFLDATVTYANGSYTLAAN
jgi:rhodanese-related sulfurtransferase